MPWEPLKLIFGENQITPEMLNKEFGHAGQTFDSMVAAKAFAIAHAKKYIITKLREDKGYLVTIKIPK